jgi:hypothetical protein
MSEQDEEAAVDSAIAEALYRAKPEDWSALWAALDALAGETTFATWAGGGQVGTTVVDGERRPVHQMGYPVYSEPVERLRDRLETLGLAVPFDWMRWEGVARYGDDPSRLADAPVEDAVRLLTAIQRSERFGDGSIEGALERGVIQAALARLRRWHDHERAPGSGPPARG